MAVQTQRVGGGKSHWSIFIIYHCKYNEMRLTMHSHAACRDHSSAKLGHT